MRHNERKHSGRRLGFAAVICCLLLQGLPVSNAQAKKDSDGQQYQELPNFHQVNANLYRGAQPRRGGIQKLASLGVKTIINLRDDDERAEAEGREARAAGLRYFNIPLKRLGRPGDADIAQALARINDAQNGVVFVHCAKGEDRTGTVIAIYRISHDGWTGEQAKKEAEHYGMKFWQRGMKDYIQDYNKGRSSPAQP